MTWYNPETGKVEITDYNSKGNWEKATYEIPVSQITNSDWGFVHLKNPNAPEVTQETQQYSQWAIDWAKNIQSWSAKIANVPSELRTEVSSALANMDTSLDEDNPIVQSLKNQYEIAAEIVDWDTDWGFFDTKNQNLIQNISWRTRFSVGNVFTWNTDTMLSKIQFFAWWTAS